MDPIQRGCVRWFLLHACVFSSCFLLLFFKKKKNLDIRYTICLDPIKIPYFVVPDLDLFCLGKKNHFCIGNLALATLACAFISGICACAISSNMSVYQGGGGDKFQHGRLSGEFAHVR